MGRRSSTGQVGTAMFAALWLAQPPPQQLALRPSPTASRKPVKSPPPHA